MLAALTWIDHTVIVVYLAGMLTLGAYLSRRQTSDDEYFLAGRRMPWFAVGMSVIASLLSSLTYLSEPGEVWNSGVTHVFGKMLAIPFEMAFVWLLCIPFMMRFKFTSAYEYLEHRFGDGSRRLGCVLFVVMVVLWMGFVVLASAKALAQVSGMPLWLIIASVGIVATLYTMLGGLRAVIWTDVVQVALLVGGGLFAILYVAYVTDSGLGDWLSASERLLTDPVVRQASIDAGQSPPAPYQFFSWDPHTRVTILTVAINMFVWHVCTHVANQMTVQRYYSTSDMRAARRSFVTGSLFGVGLNLMLVVVGLAVLYFYYGQHASAGVDTASLLQMDGLNAVDRHDRDLIFPTFAVSRLPVGLGGGVLAALLAAAMSSIDSGINSIATVISVELDRTRQTKGASAQAASSAVSPTTSPQSNHVHFARVFTLAAGTFITFAAYGLNFLPNDWGIVDAMPRTFNAVTAPLGGLFLLGMFFPRVGGRAAVAGTILGLATSLILGYFSKLGGLLVAWGLLSEAPGSISFTWVMPSALTATIVGGLLFSLFQRGTPRPLGGLTWFTRHEPFVAAAASVRKT
ncbi:MAG: sodium/solute symporter [Pirellulaceae bacterium]